MSVFNRLIRRKIQDKSIIWGIRTPEKVKMKWLMLAALMRVPTNRLILFILSDWAKANGHILLNDEARNRLADTITEAYLKKQLN